MLYEQWLRVAQDRKGDLALHEVVTGRRWSFGELRSEGERFQVGSEAVVCPKEYSAKFILTILAAWREGKVVCPLEPEQVVPSITTPLPPDCVHLKMTSATSGEPRSVAFTAGQLMADAENIVSTMGLRPEWPNVGAISIAHSYGFSNLILPLLLHGIPLVLAPSPLPEIFRRACELYSAVTVAGVPALWRAWQEAGAIGSNIRLAVSAGAPLPVGLERGIFEQCGLKIHNFYGSTECGGIAYDGSAVSRDNEAYVGTAMNGVELSINADGLLEVRSGAVGETYWPKLSAQLASGVFQTADLAEISGRRVLLRGRVGDLINVAGRKLSPELVERTLSQCPDVRECLVVGIPSTVDRTDSILAIVAATSDARAEVFKQFLLEKLPAWQVPREWWFVDSISANRRGKISRAQWRAKFLESQAKCGAEKR